MSVPSIQLNPGQIVVTPLTSEAATINGTGIQSGLIVLAYSNFGEYIAGETISFKSRNIFSFTNGDADVSYILVSEEDILFKVNIVP